MFRARLPSIFSTCHKMPRLPRNLQLVATWRSPANAICKKTLNTTRLKWCACHEKWRCTRPKCCACHENCYASSENVAKVLPLPHNDFRHVTKHLWMSRSATPATRNEATRRLKPPKMTTSAELTIGTAIWQSRGRLRTVATVNAASSERTLNPQTPRVKRERLLRIPEKVEFDMLVLSLPALPLYRGREFARERSSSRSGSPASQLLCKWHFSSFVGVP